MKITCNTIDEFLANLRERDCAVFRLTVYAEMTRRPLGSGGPDRASAFEVFYSVGTVLDFPNGDGQALLVAAELCGKDVMTADGDNAGTRRYQHLHGQVQSYCDEARLRLLPGELSMG